MSRLRTFSSQKTSYFVYGSQLVLETEDNKNMHIKNLVALASALVLGSGAMTAAFADEPSAAPDISLTEADVVMVSEADSGMPVPPPEMFITAMRGGRPNMCPFPPMSMRPDFESMMTDLSLTDEQYEKMFQAKQDFMSKAGSKITELRAQSLELRNLLSQPETDKGKIVATQNKINQLMADVANLGIEKKLACLSALTPEQRKEIRHKFLTTSCGGGHCPMKHRGSWKHKVEMSK